MVEFFAKEPREVWLAKFGDIPGLVDPDEGRRPRHKDSSDLNWKAIGDAVENAGRKLVTGSYYIDDDGDQVMTIDLEQYGFTDIEYRIVTGWLTANGPHGDPGIAGVSDGRHRLWNVWMQNPDAVLPIRSDILIYIDNVEENRELAGTMSDDVRKILKVAPQVVLDRSPQYRDTLNEWRN